MTGEAAGKTLAKSARARNDGGSSLCVAGRASEAHARAQRPGFTANGWRGSQKVVKPRRADKRYVKQNVLPAI